MAKPLITDVSKLQFSKILELIPPIEFVKYLKKAIPPFPPPHTHTQKEVIECEGSSTPFHEV